MIRSYRIDGAECRCESSEGAIQQATDAAWIDLHTPSADEEISVERIVGVPIPTREEMHEIEASSRLYRDGAAAVMTTPVLIKVRADYPENTSVTFVLTPDHLVTVRYAEPAAFATFAASARRSLRACSGPRAALTGLVDAMVDRIADVLEETGAELDGFGRSVFKGDRRWTPRDLKLEMQRLGRNRDTLSLAYESMVGMARMVAYARELDEVHADRSASHQLKTAAHDLEVLQEHAEALSGKATFLLDAMLGMINIEQNAIIKTFSIVAVVFLPPTLIASIYGMNFRNMPELSTPYGYLIALGAMVVSMVLPYLIFKRKGWV